MPRGHHHDDTVPAVAPIVVAQLPDPPDDLSPIPWVGQRVHFLGQGSSECMAAIIKRVVPPTPGLPPNDRCELVIFSPITPEPLSITAEHDETRRWTTWHWIHP
jgi:hypothetical protein